MNSHIKIISKKKSFFFKPVFEIDKKLNLSKFRMHLFLNYFNAKNLKKKINKTKKLCTFLFKRKDFFLITHIYINNKLIFVSTFEKAWKTVKFYRYFRAYFLKVVRKMTVYVSKFDKVLFIIQFKKRTSRIRKKVNRYRKKLNGKKKMRSRYRKIFVFELLVYKLCLYSIFLGKTIKMKGVFNCSHSHVREKLKKKRRK